MLHYTETMKPNEHPLPPIAWSAQLNVLSQRFAQHIAAMDGRGNSLSYAQLNQRAHALAAHLRQQGIQEGDPVGTLIPNSTDAVWVSYGVRLSGACETPLSWGYTADELRARIRGLLAARRLDAACRLFTVLRSHRAAPLCVCW